MGDGANREAPMESGSNVHPDPRHSNVTSPISQPVDNAVEKNRIKT